MDPSQAKRVIIQAVEADPCCETLTAAPTAEQFRALCALVSAPDAAPPIVAYGLDLGDRASWAEVARSVLIGPALWRTSTASGQPSIDGAARPGRSPLTSGVPHAQRAPVGSETPLRAPVAP